MCNMDDIEVTGTGTRSEGRQVREFFADYFMTNLKIKRTYTHNTVSKYNDHTTVQMLNFKIV